MRKIVLVLILSVIACTEIKAAQCGRNWTKANTIIEGVNVTTRILDYKQTRQFLKPEMRARGYYEANPALGKYPSKSRLINAGVAYSAVVAGIAYCLKPQSRKTWQAISLILSSVFVFHNQQAGFKVNF